MQGRPGLRYPVITHISANYCLNESHGLQAGSLTKLTLASLSVNVLILLPCDRLINSTHSMPQRKPYNERVVMKACAKNMSEPPSSIHIRCLLEKLGLRVRYPMPHLSVLSIPQRRQCSNTEIFRISPALNGHAFEP